MSTIEQVKQNLVVIRNVMFVILGLMFLYETQPWF